MFNTIFCKLVLKYDVFSHQILSIVLTLIGWILISIPIFPKISSQDIISILPEGNILKDFYIKEKKYYNLKSYIRELNEHCPKISIIYTFDNISCPIEGVINEMKIWIIKANIENGVKT